MSAPPIRAIVGWNGHLRWRSRNGEPFASVSLPRFPHPPAAKGFHYWLPREENRLHVPHVDPPERGGRRGTWNEEEGPSMGEPSLYERLGGVFAIAAVVNDFSDAVVQNPHRRPRIEEPRT